MKKIIFILFTLLIFIPNTKALSKFYLGEKVPNMHIESVSESEVHNGIPFILRRDDGKFVYCINPFESLNTTNYYSSYNYNDKLFNLTDEQLNKMNLIAYYGYNYGNHTDLKWYGVTQFLIWKVLNLKDIYFTDTKNGNKIIAYQNEIKEIENLVNNHYKLPSFSNNHFEYTINSSYEINDLNNILSNYEIKESNIESKIEGNALYINTNKVGNYEITFIRKSPIKREYILYALKGNQSLLYPGMINDIEFKITIEVNSGSITINKKDSENIDRKTAILEGAVYGVYDKEELINTVETDNNGIAYIENLPLGKYYVKEITPSFGYKLDENIYEINLTNENRDTIIDSYESVIKGKLIINKYYGEENNYKLEEGAVFEIYDIKDNLIGTYETKDGIINEMLEYGEYYGIQTKGITGYKFVDKFNILIDEEKDYILDLYNEKEYIYELNKKEEYITNLDNKKDEFLIVEVPNTKVNNYNKTISISLILIGLILILKSIKKTTYFE